MKQICKLLALILCASLLLCGCKKTPPGQESTKFIIPENLMTTEEYHAELEKLLEGETIAQADDAYMAKIDELTQRLKDQITYNTEDIKPEEGGTAYYVSNSGNDDNDGKSPETAWASLEKANSYRYKAGDVLLLERGGEYRGTLSARSNFKIGAYGEGHKPHVICAQTAESLGGWESTETPNVWRLKGKLSQKDLGHIVYYLPDGKEICGDKYVKLSGLKKNYDFFYAGPTAEEGRADRYVYIYYKGDPNADFVKAELPFDTKVTTAPNSGLTDFTMNNIMISHGRGPFWPTSASNILLSYCTFRWHGGFSNDKGKVRYGGGSGAWYSCDNFRYDHCWFYEQYDSGVSPQYDAEDSSPSVFKDFITENCIFEGCEYTLEYFSTQENTTENRFENMQFNYNICRAGGYGFGTKAGISAYIKSWGHENSCYDCDIKYNIFDKAASLTLEIIGYEQSASGNTLSYERIPRLSHNIYIQNKNKKFANINKIDYKFTGPDLERYISEGFDKNSRYMYS